MTGPLVPAGPASWRSSRGEWVLPTLERCAECVLAGDACEAAARPAAAAIRLAAPAMAATAAPAAARPSRRGRPAPRGCAAPPGRAAPPGPPTARPPGAV